MSLVTRKWLSRFSMDLGQARRLVERCFPDLRIKHSRQILGGWENFVLEVNSDIVFRFPINKETEQRLRTEIELLSRISKLLPVRVPDYKYVWKGDTKHRHWFGGYHKINGVPLRSVPVGRDHSAIVREISRFLQQLHSISLEKQIPRYLPNYSAGTWARRLQLHYRNIRKIVFPTLSPRLREKSEILWKNLLDSFAQDEFRPTLTHADLSIENILVSPEHRRLTGILDWGYAQIGDPALDFSHLMIDKPRLGEDILNLYPAKDQGFQRRVQWYVRSEAYYDIMWGIENHWKKAVDKGMSRLRKTMLEKAALR